MNFQRSASNKMQVPDFFASAPVIRMLDPLADFLGVADGGRMAGSRVIRTSERLLSCFSDGLVLAGSTSFQTAGLWKRNSEIRHPTLTAALEQPVGRVWVGWSQPTLKAEGPLTV